MLWVLGVETGGSMQGAAPQVHWVLSPGLSRVSRCPRVGA